MASRKELEEAWIFIILTHILNSNEMNSIIRSEHLPGAASPRPIPPYMTVKVISGPVAVGFDYEQFPKDSDDQNVEGQREYTLSIQTFGLGGQDAIDRILGLIDTQLVKDAMRLKKLSISSRGSPVDVSALLQTGFENRMNMDLGFYSVSQFPTGIEPVEKVFISAKIKRPDDTEYEIPEFCQDDTTPPPKL